MREPVIADADVVINVLLRLMTTEEKVALLGGLNMWETVAIPRLGIKSLKTTDGPAGARGSVWTGGSTFAFIPCGISLGATFNPALIYRVGRLLGMETRTKKAHIILAQQ
jgi:beta-glucosidase